jgi:hypothetical protein
VTRSGQHEYLVTRMWGSSSAASCCCFRRSGSGESPRSWEIPLWQGFYLGQQLAVRLTRRLQYEVAIRGTTKPSASVYSGCILRCMCRCEQRFEDLGAPVGGVILVLKVCLFTFGIIGAWAQLHHLIPDDPFH